MFQFPEFASCSYEFTAELLSFLIQKSPDRSLVADSPELIAGSHVFRRFLMPRHPPCTLSNLTTFIDHRQAVSGKRRATSDEFSLTTFHSPLSTSSFHRAGGGCFGPSAFAYIPKQINKGHLSPKRCSTRVLLQHDSQKARGDDPTLIVGHLLNLNLIIHLSKSFETSAFASVSIPPKRGANHCRNSKSIPIQTDKNTTAASLHFSDSSRLTGDPELSQGGQR